MKRSTITAAFILLCASSGGWVAINVNFPIAQLSELWQRIRTNASAALITSTKPEFDSWPSILAQAHKLFPLGNEFQGHTIDIYPQHTAIVLNHNGVRYTPRPAFLSLNAHTQRLAELNARHLQGHRAPDFVLFNVLRPEERINNRHPSLADGPSWPVLLSEYEFVTLTEPFAILRRRSSPSQAEHRLLLQRDVSLNEEIAVPAPTATGVIWGEVEIKRSLLGTLLHWLYKSPHVLITSHTNGGTKYTHQLVPELAAARFLISPFVANTEIFARLMQGEVRAEDHVTAIKLSSPDALPGFWDREIRLRLIEQ